MSQEQVDIEAKDGVCQAWVFTPQDQGRWPGVIFYMDAFGIRPGIKHMAQHVADQGYVVLLPDLFYRHGAYGPLDPKEVLRGDFRAIVGPLMGSTDNHKAGEDTAAFLAYLDRRPDVAGDKVGTVGFCMGGGMALTAAAFYPDRIAAAASFHGGDLATDLSVSPHLQVARINGEVYVALADNDGNYPPEMAKRFGAAMDAAAVNYTSELYAGKAHGWMKPDMPVYDAEAADRGWARLSELYARNLR
ncbi:dienelactone hydrolase family protein [Bradyrhizobium sp. RT5a]|uniref:dienelactone hydrolase family protein n=1 Tax=unclassified Bradyrhizobium TaxID=2631580 RepID=UPI00339348B8